MRSFCCYYYYYHHYCYYYCYYCFYFHFCSYVLFPWSKVWLGILSFKCHRLNTCINVIWINALEKFIIWQKQHFRGLLKKWCSENMRYIYSRTLMSNCDFKKAALQLCWNCPSAWDFSCKFTVYFQDTFL